MRLFTFIKQKGIVPRETICSAFYLSSDKKTSKNEYYNVPRETFDSRFTYPFVIRYMFHVKH